MPLTSEQIEVQRGKFEAKRTSDNPFAILERYESGEYISSSTKSFWQYWLSAIESVEIELPLRGHGYYLDDMVNLDDVIACINEAGISCREKVKP